MSALRIRSLAVHLDDSRILSDIELDIPDGSWVGLLGPNGAGKTTLLRAIGGLVPYEGSILLDGTEVSQWHRKDLARRLAFLRQSSSLTFDFRVIDLVMLGRSPWKRWLDPLDANDREAAMIALERVDLTGLETRSIHSLSGGERQRVFLAQALAQEPGVLLLDEPTAHLDIHHQLSLLEHVRTFSDGGRTVVAAFHDLDLASRYADTLVVLNHGRLVTAGPPGEVLTEDLIRRVFRVRAEISLQGDRVDGVRFVGGLANGDKD